MEKSCKKVYRLGIMGGTFDPIHYGHLVAAEMARTEFALEKVLFVPTGNPPHKSGRRVSPAALRYEMVKRSLADNPFFDISAVEIERSGPSFTVDTLRQLRREWPEHELYFITGTDALREIFTWHESEEILNLTHFIGASRPGFDAGDFLRKSESENPQVIHRIHLLEVPALAISSTAIRARVAGGKSIRYLLPENVRQFIQENSLYLTQR
ncbi:nicotinate-nucleotide adenylyltransferase [Paradesulfitobacterium aromaticivorans]